MRLVYGFMILGYFTCINAQNTSDTSSLELKQNFPNPFNPSTQVEYYLPEETYAEFNVYNILGIKITELVKSVQKKDGIKYNLTPQTCPQVYTFMN